jgi:transcriptional regulator
MYIPALYREDDLTVLHNLMRQHSFATLVTFDGSRPFASHLPFLLDTEQGEYGTLRAHMARANPQWQQFQEGQEALVIFEGPHAYISPSWYETHPSVPTWNYVAIHAYGVPRLLDEDALIRLLYELTATFEAASAPSAAYTLTEDYVQKLARGVVGFEIEIARLEGKLKMSQKSSPADREGAIAALQASGNAMNIATADWMRAVQQRAVLAEESDAPTRK